MPYEGQCLCGGCKVFVDSEPLLNGLAICHCIDCVRSNGSGFTCGVPAPSEHVRSEGSVKLHAHKNPLSGNTVSRWFCSDCGAQLLSQSSAHPERIFVKAGIIDEFTKMPITVEVFTKKRWPSIPPVPGALQVEGGEISRTMNTQAGSAESKSESESG